MTTPDPARWLPDPTGRHHERFHNGATWTGHVRETDGQVTVDPWVRRTAPLEVRRLSDLPSYALQVLAELETLLDDDGRGHDRDDEPEYLTYRRLLLTCDAADIPGNAQQAVQDLANIRRRDSPIVDRYDVRAVVLKECVGDSPTDIERSSHKASARTVRKWRREDGRDPETGKKLPGRGDTTAEKVAALSREGKSVRVIAMVLRLPKSTVHDMLVQLQDAA